MILVYEKKHIPTDQKKKKENKNESIFTRIF